MSLDLVVERTLLVLGTALRSCTEFVSVVCGSSTLTWSLAGALEDGCD